MFPSKSSLKIVALIAAGLCILPAAPPAGWFLAGSQPKDYDCSIDPEVTYNGQPATYVKSKPDTATSGFGTLMQSFDAAPFIGKRVRLSAFVKSDSISDWAGLWMRIDDSNHGSSQQPKVVGFDNMQDRSIKGTTAWQNYSVVLDVPEGATGIALGILLSGSGAAWMSGVKFETVGQDVAVTGTQHLNKGPVNLSFEK